MGAMELHEALFEKLSQGVGVIGDARQELGRCGRSRFSLRIRNRHDGRVRTRQRDTFKTNVLC